MKSNNLRTSGSSGDITFAQTVQYARRRYAFGISDQHGAGVVHQDLVRAVLSTDSARELHLYLDTYSEDERRVQRHALEELRQEFGKDRIQVKQASELEECAKSHRYAFVVPGVDFQPLSQVRLSRPDLYFPICALLHSIDSAHMILNYVSAFLFAEPYDAIVATSKAGRTAVEALLDSTAEFIKFKLGEVRLPQVQIAEIPLGVDTNFLTPYDRKYCRRLLDLPPDDILILYTGRLSQQQKADLEPLLVACSRLFKEIPNASLVIAGQDAFDVYGQEVKSLAQSLGIAEKTTTIVNFPHFTKPLIYSACDMFVSPVDNVQETFGLSVIEAMACGLPVIASDWSGYKDTVAHGETGFKVTTTWNPAAADAISSIASLCDYSVSRHFLARRTTVDVEELYSYLKLLAQDNAMRQRLGENARRRAVEVFGWEVVMGQWRDLWHDQWQRIISRPAETPRKLVFDYNSLFGHFASEWIGPDYRMRCSERGKQLLNEVSSAHELIVPAGISLEDVLTVLAASVEKPQLISQLLQQPGSNLLYAISWSSKKGYLERVSQNA